MMNYLSLIVLCSLANCMAAIEEVDCLKANLIPAQFQDSMLDPEGTNGSFIDHLGRVLSLKTTMSPKSITKLATKFTLHTRRSNSQEIIFLPHSYHHDETYYGDYPYNLELLANSGFNASLRTVIMIAGFLSDDVVPWIEDAREKWLRLQDINFIQVTWSDANKYIYSTAVADTPLIARQITIFLYYLFAVNELYFRDPEMLSRIHFVGHSLGAHIGGFVGQDLGGQLGRITGLDPAGPSFDTFPPSHRLDHRDALLVDVIHTNRGVMKYMNAMATAPITAMETLVNKLPLLSLLSASLAKEYSGEGDTAWFGIDKQVGHIDYYANDGRVQPGCKGLLHVCDHGRATDVLIDILRYESALRNLGPELSQRKSSRLLAFNAIDYESFLSGANFNVQCPPLMQLNEHLSERVAETIKFCSLPIDLLTPVEELRRELASEYNVDFEDRTHQSERKYFFKTQDSAHMLMGDHFVLKLHVDEVMWNPEVCRLQAEIEISPITKVTVELSEIVKSVDGSYPRVIAMPFVNNWGAAFKWREIVNRRLGRVGAKNSSLDADVREFLDQRHHLLPKRVKIDILDAKATGIFETVKNKLKKMIKGQESASCMVEIGMIEVHPIVEWPRNYAGLYEVVEEKERSHDENNVGHLRVYRPEEQVHIPWKYEYLSRLKQAFSMSISASLAGIVVGD